MSLCDSISWSSGRSDSAKPGSGGLAWRISKRVGVVDEQADRQLGVEFLQQEKVGGVRVRRSSACLPRGSC